MNGPGIGAAGHSSVARITAPFGQFFVSGGGGGTTGATQTPDASRLQPSGQGGGGGGGASGAPKLKVMPPSNECDRKRDSDSRPRKSTVRMLSALKKR